MVNEVLDELAPVKAEQKKLRTFGYLWKYVIQGWSVCCSVKRYGDEYRTICTVSGHGFMFDEYSGKPDISVLLHPSIRL